MIRERRRGCEDDCWTREWNGIYYIIAIIIVVIIIAVEIGRAWARDQVLSRREDVLYAFFVAKSRKMWRASITALLYL